MRGVDYMVISKRAGEVVEATSLKEFIERSKERLVVIDFHANWCAPCKVLSPNLKRLAGEMGFLLVEVDVDKSPDEASKFDVRGIPSVFMVRDGKLVDKFVGARDAEFIRAKVSKYL